MPNSSKEQTIEKALHLYNCILEMEMGKVKNILLCLPGCKIVIKREERYDEVQNRPDMVQDMLIIDDVG